MANLSDKAFSSQYNYPNQKLVTSSIGTVTDLVDLSGAGYKTLTLLTSSGSAFSACLVQASPDPISGTVWETVDGTTFTTLGTGTTKSGIYNDNRRFWRVRGNTAAGSVNADSWWSI